MADQALTADEAGEARAWIEVFRDLDPRLVRAAFTALLELPILADIKLDPNPVGFTYTLGETRKDSLSKPLPNNCSVTVSVDITSRGLPVSGAPLCIIPEYHYTIRIVKSCLNVPDEVLKETTGTHRGVQLCGQTAQPSVPSIIPAGTDSTDKDGGKTVRYETLRYPPGVTVQARGDGTKVEVTITLPDGTVLTKTVG